MGQDELSAARELYTQELMIECLSLGLARLREQREREWLLVRGHLEYEAVTRTNESFRDLRALK